MQNIKNIVFRCVNIYMRMCKIEVYSLNNIHDVLYINSQSRSSFLVATCRCPRMCVLNYEIVISVQTINKYQHDL